MLYLSSADGPGLRQAIAEGVPLGYMATPDTSGSRAKIGHFPAWAADNGCYSRGAAFDLGRYLAWLTTLPDRSRCLFATAPDVVGDARSTWERSRHVLPVLRALGYRAALVAQDGLEIGAVPWDDLDALFVGGTTAWKLSETAYALAREAKRRGKWAHMGRANSLIRLRAAVAAGYDSADGTMLRFRPDVRLDQLRRWLGRLGAQPALWQEGGAA